MRGGEVTKKGMHRWDLNPEPHFQKRRRREEEGVGGGHTVDPSKQLIRR